MLLQMNFIVVNLRRNKNEKRPLVWRPEAFRFKIQIVNVGLLVKPSL